MRAAFVVLAFILLWTAEVAPAIVFEVEIDIKPGSEENPVNLKSRGVITVAILTTDYFDATTVDPLTVQFGPGGAAECHERGHIEDVDEDGDLDMVLHFRTEETGIEWDDTEAYLDGYTIDGMAIEGRDSIMTVPLEGEENGDVSSEADEDEGEDEDEGPGKGKAKGKNKVKVRGNSNANAEDVDDDEDEGEAEDEDRGKGKAKGRGKSKGKGRGKGNKAPAEVDRISPTVWGKIKVR